MYITILYYIIYTHINFAFDSFFSKNKREREREREREGKGILCDLGSYIMIFTIIISFNI